MKVTCQDPHCDERFETRDEMLKHDREEHRADFKCDVCGLVLKTAAGLVKHKKRHVVQAEREFQCDHPDCDAGFVTKSDLLKHQLKHRQLKVVFCCFHNGCNAQYSTKADLKRHMKVSCNKTNVMDLMEDFSLFNNKRHGTQNLTIYLHRSMKASSIRAGGKTVTKSSGARSS